jgi:hypothetical protein
VEEEEVVEVAEEEEEGEEGECFHRQVLSIDM